MEAYAVNRAVNTVKNDNEQYCEDDYVVDTKKYKWREPGAGRGYWRGGVWIGF